MKQVYLVLKLYTCLCHPVLQVLQSDWSSLFEETQSCNRVTIFMTLLSIFIADVSHHRPTSVRSSRLLISTANVL